MKSFKKKFNITPYVQIISVFSAFLIITFSCYFFMSNMEHKNMLKNMDDLISYTQNDIMRNLHNHKAALENVANIVLLKYEYGESEQQIKEYLNEIQNQWKYFHKETKHEHDIINLEGVFEIFGDKKPNDVIYQDAVKAKGEAVLLEPTWDPALNMVIAGYAVSILDKNGKFIGVIYAKFDFKLAENLVENMDSARGGFGIMLNSKLQVVAHKNHNFIGKSINSTNIPLKIFYGELEQKKEINEQAFTNWLGVESVMFFKLEQNNWYYGVVIPKANYYREINKILIFICIMGLVFSIVLGLISSHFIKTKEIEKVNEITSKKNKEFEKMSYWYKSILDAVNLPITVMDLETNWTFVNNAVEKFLNIEEKEVIGKPCRNWTEICTTQKCAIEAVKRGEHQTFFMRDGRSYQINVDILRDGNHNPTGYIEIVQDITQVEKLAKSEAEAASKAKSNFLAKMSHEIRTPMNAIMGITNLELQKSSMSPKLKASFMTIYNSGNLLLSIINNILDLSKIEAGKMELINKRYQTVSLINDVIQINSVLNKDKNIKFEIYVDKDIPLKMIGDEIRIKQVLNNLLSNAFKYTDKGSVKLSVSAQRETDKETVLVFEIKDTGQGMSSAQIDKIFTSEYIRYNLEANRLVEGTGLGINISNHLLQMMGGNISATSELNKGSTFRIHLPQKIVDAEVIGEVQAENLMNMRIKDVGDITVAKINREYMPYGSVLIVDDVESNLFIAKELMIPYGLSIETVFSGQEAINKIENGKSYDIIFMDHMMPKMDGIEATKRIRALGYEGTIIALTANALIGQAKVFMDNGFDGFISKPIDIKLLNVKLNKFIRDKKSPEIVAAARKKVPSNKKAPVELEVNPSLLAIFVKDVKKALPTLEQLEDLDSYAINVHAMKGILASIGEEEASRLAFELETAAKEKTKEVLEEKTPKLIEILKNTSAEIEKKLNAEKSIFREDSDTEFLYAQLKFIEKACEDYDISSAKKALKKLNDMSWTENTQSALKKITEFLLHSDFENAANFIKKFLEDK